MRVTNRFFAMCAISCMLLQSCAILYVAPSAQTPQFHEQGDFHGAIAAGTNGFDLKVAYAPAKSLGAWGTLSMQKSDENDHRHTYGEFAAGWFLTNSEALTLGAYGGVGFGSAVGESTQIFNGNSSNEIVNADYFRPFLQGNIGTHNDFVDAGVALRIAHVSMQYWKGLNQSSMHRESNTFFEPIAYVGIGYAPVKFTFQSGVSYPLSQPKVVGYNPFVFSIGLALDLNLLGNRQEN